VPKDPEIRAKVKKKVNAGERILEVWPREISDFLF